MNQTEIFTMCMGLGQRDFDQMLTMEVLQSNRSIFWSWGVSKRVKMTGGLMIKVSGHHHKGWVLITLGWDDLYRVHIIGNRGKVLDTYEGIFFDYLVEVIDSRIEKISDYKF